MTRPPIVSLFLAEVIEAIGLGDFDEAIRERFGIEPRGKAESAPDPRKHPIDPPHDTSTPIRFCVRDFWNEDMTKRTYRSESYEVEETEEGLLVDGKRLSIPDLLTRFEDGAVLELRDTGQRAEGLWKKTSPGSYERVQVKHNLRLETPKVFVSRPPGATVASWSKVLGAECYLVRWKYGGSEKWNIDRTNQTIIAWADSARPTEIHIRAEAQHGCVLSPYWKHNFKDDE